MHWYAVQYKETSGIQRTFNIIFKDKSNAHRFDDYINEHGDVPPVDDNLYYESMVCESQINPEEPPKRYHGRPLEYINSQAREVSDSDCYGDAEQLVSDYG